QGTITTVVGLGSDESSPAGLGQSSFPVEQPGIMKVKEFLAHYGVGENPFGQEDAQSDHVFRDHCLEGTHHPAWDKIFGNPGTPSTSVVFGEKGSGKTALRLQIAKE